jgi:hypothetical protein
VDATDKSTHKIVIASTGKRQRIYFDGLLVHDLTDNGSTCINKKSWQHELPCEGTGPAPQHGAFGIRLTQKQQARFDNIRVYQLRKLDEK